MLVTHNPNPTTTTYVIYLCFLFLFPDQCFPFFPMKFSFSKTHDTNSLCTLQIYTILPVMLSFLKTFEFCFLDFYSLLHRPCDFIIHYDCPSTLVFYFLDFLTYSDLIPNLFSPLDAYIHILNITNNVTTFRPHLKSSFSVTTPSFWSISFNTVLL